MKNCIKKTLDFNELDFYNNYYYLLIIIIILIIINLLNIKTHIYFERDKKKQKFIILT